MQGTLALLLGGILILSSCHSNRRVDVYDGFESQELSPIWSDWRFLPGAVEIQSEIIKYGKFACKITLRPGDQMDDEKGTILERAELAELPDLVSLEELDYAYSFSLFIPQDFPIVATRLIIAQWKQYRKSESYSVDNPVIAMRYQSGKLRIESKVGMQKTVLCEQTEELRNKWLDFKFHIRFSRGENGHIKVWMNEKAIIDYTGITAYPEKYGYTIPSYFYFKMGLYRDQIPEPMTIYIDEYRKQQLSDASPKNH